MLASTSRAVATLGRASFSTSASCASRSVVVELLQDVPGLGSKHDMVAVAPGRAHHALLPSRQARFVPWKTARTRPREWKTHAAPPVPDFSALLTAPSETITTTTPAELLAMLDNIPPVIPFARLTVSPSSPALHGSVTIDDLVAHLTERYGLPASSVSVEWVERESGARMKELGSWEARVQVRGFGREEVPVVVDVVRE